MLKRLDECYVQGGRPANNWYKAKKSSTFDCVVLGFTRGKGKYNETISVVGTPTTVHVQQAVGGTILLDQSATPTYADYHPSCGPVCKEALVTWTMP